MSPYVYPPLSPVYLACISRVSRVYLPCISRVPRQAEAAEAARLQAEVDADAAEVARAAAEVEAKAAEVEAQVVTEKEAEEMAVEEEIAVMRYLEQSRLTLVKIPQRLLLIQL